MKIAKILVGSLAAVAFGSAVCAMLWTLVAFVMSGSKPWESLWFGLYVLGIGGVCSLVVWATVFVWVYAFVPRDSRLWHWPICTPCGGGAGLLIVAVLTFFGGSENDWQMIVVYGSSAFVTGASTCWFAARTANNFRPE